MTAEDERKALIREIAREVIREVVPDIMRTHVATCPWGKKVALAYAYGGGIVAVLAVVLKLLN